jgi:hypothetical protein
MRSAINEAHQGVMTDKQHSLKIGDRLSKKERQTTASDWEKATNCDLLVIFMNTQSTKVSHETKSSDSKDKKAIERKWNRIVTNIDKTIAGL